MTYDTVLRLEEIDEHGVKFYAIAFRLTPFKLPRAVFERWIGNLESYNISFESPLRVIAEVADIYADAPEIISLRIPDQIIVEMDLFRRVE